MIVVAHELGFARSVTDTVCFLNDGCIVASVSPGAFFSAPKSERPGNFCRGCCVETGKKHL